MISLLISALALAGPFRAGAADASRVHSKRRPPARIFGLRPGHPETPEAAAGRRAAALEDLRKKGGAFDSAGYARAVRARRSDLVYDYLDAGMDPNARILGVPMGFIALQLRDTDTLWALWRHGMDLEARDPDGSTLFLRAAREGFTSGLNELLRMGASPAARGPGGESPVLAAAGRGNSDALRFLLSRGGDPRSRETGGARANALMLAVRAGDPETVRLLLEAGGRGKPRDGERPEAGILDAEGDDALRYLLRARGEAPRLTEILTLLKRAGFDIDAKDREGDTTLISALKGRAPLPVIQSLLNSRADPRAVGADGNSPLHWAAITADRAAAEALLAAGADPRAENRMGRTPGGLALRIHPFSLGLIFKLLWARYKMNGY